MTDLESGNLLAVLLALLDWSNSALDICSFIDLSNSALKSCDDSNMLSIFDVVCSGEF